MATVLDPWPMTASERLQVLAGLLSINHQACLAARVEEIAAQVRDLEKASRTLDYIVADECEFARRRDRPGLRLVTVNGEMVE